MATNAQTLEATQALQGQVSTLTEAMTGLVGILTAQAVPVAPNPAGVTSPKVVEPTPVNDAPRFESGNAFMQNGILWVPCEVDASATAVSQSGKSIPTGRNAGKFVIGGRTHNYGLNVYVTLPKIPVA